MPYLPSKPPPTTTDDGTALGFYLEDELSRLASSLLDDVQAVEVRPAHAAPLRPREGMLVYADGTDWNPGKGEGTYTYGSDAAWHLLENKTISLTTDVSGILPVANGGTADSGAAWTTWTPTVVPAAGAFTTVAATGSYLAIGKLVLFTIEITITTVGTASGAMSFALPVGTAKRPAAVLANETATVGLMGYGRIASAGSTVFAIQKYDNSSYIGAGAKVVLTGFYEKT